MLKAPTGCVFSARTLPNLRLRLAQVPQPPAAPMAELMLVLAALDGGNVLPVLEQARCRQLTLRRERRVDASQVNFALPPLSTLRSWELPPPGGDATHFHSNVAFVQLALRTPGIPLLHPSPRCTIVPVSSATDARPLNLGVYGREIMVDGQLTVQLGGALRKLPDGTLVPFDAATLAHLLGAGNEACRQAMQNAVYVKEVLETYSTDLSSQICLNTSTWYHAKSPSALQIAEAIKQRKAALECCIACIQAGLTSCEKGADGLCDRCRDDESLRCEYLKEVMSIADKESEQSKALNNLHAAYWAARPQFLSSEFLCIGFGIRHFIKSPISALRGHRLASPDGGELSISMLRAFVCSRSPLATQLARVTRSDVC